VSSESSEPAVSAAAPPPDELRWDTSGLVAGVVQDEQDGRVLMVGWLDAEALAATLQTGEVHFRSRSRHRLWRKGETSGNVLRLRSLAVDCDGDALLIGVDPVGPTCHRGTRSCFDRDGSPYRTPARIERESHAAAPDRRPAEATPRATAGDAEPLPTAAPRDVQGFAWLETLWATIVERVANRPTGSYTVRLIEGGVDLVGRKVMEEATELLLAAKNDAGASAVGPDREPYREALAGEAADLVYHALVLLAERGLEPLDVLEVLRRRQHRDR
jgi:phosphoribosyl-ATP pyrophosphohydrolase/phosphoribosyl-AMP cyclohydrolase